MAIEILTDEQKEHGKAQGTGALFQRAPGTDMVYNRLSKPFEKHFDGTPFRWESHETVSLPTDIAQFMYRTSVVSYEPVTGKAVRALVTPEDETFGIPYGIELGPELLDRSISDNYIQRGTDGVPTAAKLVEVKGGGYDQGRKISSASRL